ncbi:MAG: 4'-phosphopantetheinyl transferase superfamily protein [Phycisphaerales bacterium]|nr:4'-phosphopantetheinyl transferase superfamily protein [Phycisphaerales bacterium]
MFCLELVSIDTLLKQALSDRGLLTNLLNNSNFHPEVIKHIHSYYQIPDKIRAYQSAIFKYQFLPDYYQWSRQEVKIETDKYHRPYYLISPFKIDFNISHSGNWVVLAHKKGNSKIGIDIEYLDHSIDYNTLKPITFSETEQTYIQSPLSFFTLWAKKEALIKTVGKGFLDDMYIHTVLDLSPEQQYTYQKKTYYLKQINVASEYLCFTCEEE